MMELVRQWLTGIICASLIAALADGLMPKGAVRQVGRVVCALVLLCALLRPVLSLNLDTVHEFHAGAWNMEQTRVQLEQHSDTLFKTFIEHQCQTYIVDKAAKMGLECQVQVACRADETGIWLPRSVIITGRTDAQQQAELTAAVQNEFGIVPEFRVDTGGE